MVNLQMDNSWIDRYMDKCEKKYEISELAIKVLREAGITSRDDERLRLVGKIILEHFLHLESK